MPDHPRPRTEYAVAPDGVHLAYQVVGEGDRDIVFFWAAWSNIEVIWEYPPARTFLERFQRMGRLILFDKRGTGVSDRACAVPTLDQQIDDLVAVMDAVGSERAHVFAGGDASMMACTFAAMHPARVASITLAGARASGRQTDPTVVPDVDQLQVIIDAVYENWGRGLSQKIAAPSDPGGAEWWSRIERLSVSKGSITSLWRSLLATDVSAVLPAIQSPTLVVHRTGDRFVPIELGRQVAAAIPGARFVELPGSDHAGWNGDSHALVDVVEEFITGASAPERTERALATVMFTDIVGSTEIASSLGDTEWMRLLRSHHEAAEQEIESRRGRLVKTVGDGIVATFDGPTRAIAAADALRAAAAASDLQLRAGLHTGEIEVGRHDIGGLGVHIAARIESAAEPGDVLVSRTVVDLVAGSGLRFENLGEHRLKGIQQSWELHRLL